MCRYLLLSNDENVTDINNFGIIRKHEKYRIYPYNSHFHILSITKTKFKTIAHGYLKIACEM